MSLGTIANGSNGSNGVNSVPGNAKAKKNRSTTSTIYPKTKSEYNAGGNNQPQMTAFKIISQIKDIYYKTETIHHKTIEYKFKFEEFLKSHTNLNDLTTTSKKTKNILLSNLSNNIANSISDSTIESLIAPLNRYNINAYRDSTEVISEELIQNCSNTLTGSFKDNIDYTAAILVIERKTNDFEKILQDFLNQDVINKVDFNKTFKTILSSIIIKKNDYLKAPNQIIKDLTLLRKIESSDYFKDLFSRNGENLTFKDDLEDKDIYMIIGLKIYEQLEMKNPELLNSKTKGGVEKLDVTPEVVVKAVIKLIELSDDKDGNTYLNIEHEKLSILKTEEEKPSIPTYKSFFIRHVYSSFKSEKVEPEGRVDNICFSVEVVLAFALLFGIIYHFITVKTQEGIQEGIQEGRQEGYEKGFQDAHNQLCDKKWFNFQKNQCKNSYQKN